MICSVLISGTATQLPVVIQFVIQIGLDSTRFQRQILRFFVGFDTQINIFAERRRGSTTKLLHIAWYIQSRCGVTALDQLAVKSSMTIGFTVDFIKPYAGIDTIRTVYTTGGRNKYASVGC